MKEKPPSVFGKMVVHSEDGIDRICRGLERRKRAGEKLPTAEEIREEQRRLREKFYGEGSET